MEPLDIAPAVSLSLRTTRARMPQNPLRRAWHTSAAVGVIGCILAAWGSAPSAAPTVQVQAAPVSDSAALAAACDAGAAIACNDLGVVSLHATPSDSVLAVQSFQRACEGGSPDGCSNLGALYEHGAGIRCDLSEAAALYQRACDGGAALGCSNLGALYARGKGVARDRSEARRLFEQACEGGSAMGCNNLMQVSAKHAVAR